MRGRRTGVAVLGALTAGLLALPTVGLASPGDVDPSFAGDGSAELGPGYAADVLVEPRGAVLVAGTSGLGDAGRLAVARLTPAGAPDTAFGGGDGLATPQVGAAGEPSSATVLARGWAGRVLVAGVAGAEGARRLVVARLLQDGSLDRGFAGDGVQEVALPPEGRAPADLPAALTQLPDGRVVAVVVGAPAPVLVRLTNGGAPDRSLDEDGVRVLDAAGIQGGTSAAVVDRVGRVLVGAETYDDELDANFAVTRYTPSGAVDATFGTAGTTLGEPPSAFFVAPVDLVVAPDLDVVAALGIFTSANSNDTGLARLTDGGELDPTFGDGGVLQRDLAPEGLDPFREPPNDGIGSLALTSGGRIVGAGFAEAPGGTFQDFGLLAIRLTREGVLDRGFGAGGIVRGPVGVRANAVAVRPDGRAVVATTDQTAGFEARTWGVTQLQGDRADLRTVVVEAPVQARVSATVRLTVRVENAGPQPAYDTVLDVGASGPQVVFDEPVVRLGRLDPGEQVTVTVPVRIVGEPGTLVLRPRLRSAVLDPNPGNDAPRATVRVVR